MTAIIPAPFKLGLVLLAFGDLNRVGFLLSAPSALGASRPRTPRLWARPPLIFDHPAMPYAVRTRLVESSRLAVRMSGEVDHPAGDVESVVG